MLRVESGIRSLPLSVPYRKHKLSLIGAGLVLLVATLAFARAPVGAALFERGRKAKQEWRLESAAKYFSWAVRLRSGGAQARFEQGLSLQLRGEFRAAQREFEPLAQSLSGQDLTLQAHLLDALGVNHFNFNEPDRALDLHRQSLAIARQLGDRHRQAQALINTSRVLYYSKGQGEEALKQLDEALQLARDAQDSLSEADALRNAGVIHWWHRGERERPLQEFYLPALALYREHNDLRGAAITLSNISLIHWARGDAYQFLKYQSESSAIKERIGDLAGLSDSYLYLSWFYANLRNQRRARDYLIQSVELSRSIGYQLGQNEAEATLVPLHIELAEFDNAIELLKHLAERDRANPMLLKYRLAYLGICHRLRNEPATAREYFEQTLALNKQAGGESELDLLTRIGETWQDEGQWERAREFLSRADAIGFTETEKNWWHWMNNRRAWARQMEHEGRHREARKYLLEATEIEMQIIGANGAAPVPGDQHVFNQTLSSLLTGPDKERGAAVDDKLAFRLLERLRYRAFRDLVVRVSDQKSASVSSAQKEQAAFARVMQASKQLRTEDNENALTELRRAYSNYEDTLLQSQLNEPQYQLVREARPAELEEVQRVLDPETAIVEYVFAEEKVFALVLTRASLQSVALPVTKANLSNKVRLLRTLMFGNAASTESGSAANENDDWRPVAEDLRSALIQPIEQTGALTNIRRIAIVPFGFLHDLPFAALVRNEGENGKFLIEDYTIFHAPSATFLTDAVAAATPPARTLISFGRNDADEDQLGPLLFAEEEASSVAGVFGGQARVGAAATETEFKQLAPRFSHIHLATHAVSEPLMPLMSRIKLNGAAPDDGSLTVREIFNLKLRAELVTLGACRTGQSFAASGSEASEVDRIGLLDAFLHAGSGSALATLVPIRDRATLVFMKTFYANLQTQDKAEALAATQRAALRGQLSYTANDQTYQLTQPRHWAAFILVGDYR